MHPRVQFEENSLVVQSQFSMGGREPLGGSAGQLSTGDSAKWCNS